MSFVRWMPNGARDQCWLDIRSHQDAAKVWYQRTTRTRALMERNLAKNEIPRNHKRMFQQTIISKASSWKKEERSYLWLNIVEDRNRVRMKTTVAKEVVWMVNLPCDRMMMISSSRNIMSLKRGTPTSDCDKAWQCGVWAHELTRWWRHSIDHNNKTNKSRFGADMTTFLAPLLKWAEALSINVNTPVDSQCSQLQHHPRRCLTGPPPRNTWIGLASIAIDISSTNLTVPELSPCVM